MNTKVILLGILMGINSVYSYSTSLGIEGKWDVTNDRSIPTDLWLLQMNNEIYLHSEKDLQDLYIQIKDLSGNIFCSKIIEIHIGENYFLPLTNSLVGEYLIEVSDKESIHDCFYIKSNY